MTDFPARNKPPHDITVINRRLTQVAGDTGVAAGWLRRWLGFEGRVACAPVRRRPAD